ncbi:TPA: hypothetical protein EYN98_18170 [Candidatus Poribacteria bacterium]|nr:hypothetical protein [Candidatus Poribacteria bacterium]
MGKQSTVTWLYKHRRFYDVRRRALYILLSLNGRTVTQLIDVFQVDRLPYHTVLMPLNYVFPVINKAPTAFDQDIMVKGDMAP